MNEPKTYTAKDIERYHRGEMTPAEMRLLEEASLDDPFLADALEGYQNTTAASEDLGVLQKRLQQRIENKRKSGAIIFMQPWMKVAAVLVVLIGGGWLAFQTLSERSGEFVNLPSRSNAGVEKSTAAQLPDSTSTVSGFAPPLADSNGQAKETNGVASINPKSKPYLKRKEPTPVTAPGLPYKDASSNDKSGYDANALAKAEASSISKDTNFSRNTEESTAAVSVPALDTIRHVDVAMKPLENDLQEVIVTTAKTKRLANRTQAVTIDTLEPAQGWSSFDNYVADNLAVPKELKEKKPLNNEVELSFDVDEDGSPVNIAVTKSLCDKCDQEAIRLLKEGPKWKGRKKSGKVKIKFQQSP